MDSNSRSLNFLITSRGYHRYPILYKRCSDCLPPFTLLSLSPSFSHHLGLCLSFILSVSKLTVFLLTVVSFFSICLFLFCFPSWRWAGEGHCSSYLLSSLLCCHRNKEDGDACCVFFLFPEPDSGQCWKEKWKKGGRVTTYICICKTPTLIATQRWHEQLCLTVGGQPSIKRHPCRV